VNPRIRRRFGFLADSAFRVDFGLGNRAGRDQFPEGVQGSPLFEATLLSERRVGKPRHLAAANSLAVTFRLGMAAAFWSVRSV